VKLYLLRHAPVQAEAGLCYGAADLAAWPDHTCEIAARMAPGLPAGIALHSSPRTRCMVLAQAIAALRAELPRVQADPRIAEMDFGAWEGRPWHAVERSEFDGWIADFADARAGGHGESVRGFMERVGAAWDAWRACGRDALWVTHAGVMRAALLLHQGVRCPVRSDQWPAQAIAFGECVEIDVSR
jgi:alpha-ribazole phosphatase